MSSAENPNSEATPEQATAKVLDSIDTATNAAKNEANKSAVVNVAANFAMEQLTQPSERLKAISQLWYSLSAEEQDQFLTGSTTVARLSRGMIPFLREWQTIQDLKWLIDIARGNAPETMQQAFKVEIKACVGLGILKCKNPDSLKHVDTDAQAAKIAGRTLEAVLHMSGQEELATVLGILTKIADVGGDYLAEMLPKIRAEVARRQEIQAARQSNHDAIAKVLNEEPANNTTSFETANNTTYLTDDDSASSPSEAAAA